jgi:hypothetical protein
LFNQLRRVALFASLAFAVAGPAVAQINVTATLDNATMQTDRTLRGGIAQTCAGTVAYPGVIGSAPRAYDAFTVTNPAAVPVCYRVSLQQPASNLYVVGYLNSFNPANIAENWLGSAGSSTTTGSFDVTVPAGQTLVVVVHDVDGSGVGQTYSLTAEPVPAAVPTLSEWALILLGLSFAGGAVLVLQGRRAAPAA